MESPADPIAVVILGATGAVGSRVVATLQTMPEVERVALLSRRLWPGPVAPKVVQHLVDPLNPGSYRDLLPGHRAAICTFGVGQPSGISRAEFVRLDKDTVLAFAAACKQAGVRHFELLGSVGADPHSRSFYLRTKGELREGLAVLGFERLSIFQPSMILTPTNRYGVLQGLTLALWPLLHGFLVGGWRKYRGIAVEKLGAAMARNLAESGSGLEVYEWPDLVRLSRPYIGRQGAT